MKFGKPLAAQLAIWTVLGVLLMLTFVPMLMMLIMSFRSNAQIYSNFWSPPSPWIFRNYILGFTAIIRYVANSLIASSSTVLGVVFLSSISGYVFARHRFPGKEGFFYFIIALLMIPGILTFIPAYVLVKQIGLLNTRWVLILPWTAGGQVFGIFLCRSFFATIPEELFEAARIDGASEFGLYYRIAIPLSYPILITLAILHMVGTYNDYIWPLVTVSSTSLQVVSVGLTQFTSQYGVTDYGPRFAAYAIATFPLMALFLFGMRYFIQGITAGALKL